MRGLIWVLVLAALATAVALHGKDADGYVLVFVPPYRVETSLVVAGLLALLAFGVGYALLRGMHHVVEAPSRLRAFRERRRRDRAQAALVSSIQAYFEGRHARAEQEAREAHSAGYAPGIAALIAARAAHAQHDVAGRDQWLALANEAGESLQLARSVTQAELALEERDFGAARRALHETSARHPAAQRMLLRAERGAGNWEEVLRLTSQLGKRDAIAPVQSEEYRVQAHVELLERAGRDREEFATRWHRIPARERTQARLAAAAAGCATRLGAADLAREIIEKALGEDWDAGLVREYGSLPDLDASQRPGEALTRIARAEKWLLQRPEDPVLLCTLGRLCVQAELWGKAQSYLEASLAFDPAHDTLLELAHLAEALGRSGEAAQYYRRAAETA